MGRAGSHGLRLGGFPAKRLAKLRYVSFATLGNSTTISVVGYRLNSVYDTYIPAGGHQPRFFDQWSALYTKYTVIGAKITMEWVPTTSTQCDVNPAQFGIYIPAEANDGNIPSVGATPASIFENKRMGPVRMCGKSVVSTRGRNNKVTKYWSAKKFFGVSDIVKNGGVATADTPFTAAVTANPANIANAYLYVNPLDGTATTGEFTFKVTVDFITLFSDLIEPGGS